MQNSLQTNECTSPRSHFWRCPAWKEAVFQYFILINWDDVAYSVAQADLRFIGTLLPQLGMSHYAQPSCGVLNPSLRKSPSFRNTRKYCLNPLFLFEQMKSCPVQASMLLITDVSEWLSIPNKLSKDEVFLPPRKYSRLWHRPQGAYKKKVPKVPPHWTKHTFPQRDHFKGPAQLYCVLRYLWKRLIAAC